jgi:nitrate reductase beta subunit
VRAFVHSSRIQCYITLQQKKLKEQDVVESVILAERAILYTLAFQIKIELPQTPLFRILEVVGVYTFSPMKGTAPESKLPAEQQRKLSQVAVNFANDR